MPEFLLLATVLATFFNLLSVLKTIQSLLRHLGKPQTDVWLKEWLYANLITFILSNS